MSENKQLLNKKAFPRLRRAAPPIVVAVLLITVVTALLIGYYKAMEQAKERAEGVLFDAASEQVTIFSAKVEANYRQLEVFTAELSERNITDLDYIMGRMDIIQRHTDFTYFSYALPDGQLFENDYTYLPDISSRGYFQTALSGRRGAEYIDNAMDDGQPYCVLSAPVMRADGTVQGVAIAYFTGQVIGDLLSARAFGGQSYSMLCDGRGRILAYSPSSKALIQPNDNKLFGIYNLLARSLIEEGTVADVMHNLAGGLAASVSFTYNGNSRYAVFVPTGIMDWFLVYAVSYDVIVAEAKQTTQTLLIMVLIITSLSLLMILFIYWLDKRNSLMLAAEQERLRISEQEYRIAAQHSNKMLFRYDLKTSAVSLDEESVRVLGLPAEIVNVPDSVIKAGAVCSVSENDYKEFFAKMQQGQPTGSCTVCKRLADGKAVWHQMHYTLVFDNNHEPVYSVISCEDVTEKRAKVQELIARSQEDALTGVLNRVSFAECVDGLIALQPSALHVFIMLDLDNFKKVNDSFGHIVGDRVLTEVAQALKDHLRDGDLVGRLGGDEFVVFLKDLPDIKVAVRRASLLCRQMRLLVSDNDHVSASLGVACYPADGKSFAELYQNADIAVYRAKQAGRNRIEFYNQSNGG